MKKQKFTFVRKAARGLLCRMQTYLIVLSCSFMSSLLICSLSASVSAQQRPAISVGSQMISITYEECLARAKRSLQSEGFAAERGGGNFYWGGKGIHHATIVCDGTPHPDKKIDVHVFVASTSGDGNLPGAERVRLQEQMERGTAAGGTAIDWGKQADSLRGRNGERFTFTCPANGRAGGRLWGTDIYTDDSSICTAAVHAGLITYDSGGTVTIEIRPGQQSYQGSSRNGAASAGYGFWHGSFVFVR